jgi:hypothetical protein
MVFPGELALAASVKAADGDGSSYVSPLNDDDKEKGKQKLQRNTFPKLKERRK